MVEVAKYLDLRSRPFGRAAMTQRWRTLLFLHFPADVEEIQPLLPSGLTVDTYPDASGEEKAWVGLVPFRMEGVTPVGFPEVPGLHAFPETNVRTYVHRDGQKPGVWFFSLDAANHIACRVARRFYGLPYHEARMSVVETLDIVRYSSIRCDGHQRCGLTCSIGETLPLPEPGSIEFFLVERYLLHSIRAGKLCSGRVFHSPYRVSSATASDLNEDLVGAAGIQPRPFVNTLFSPGVDVEVFSLVTN